MPPAEYGGPIAAPTGPGVYVGQHTTAAESPSPSVGGISSLRLIPNAVSESPKGP